MFTDVAAVAAGGDEEGAEAVGGREPPTELAVTSGVEGELRTGQALDRAVEEQRIVGGAGDQEVAAGADSNAEHDGQTDASAQCRGTPRQLSRTIEAHPAPTRSWN